MIYKQVKWILMIQKCQNIHIKWFMDQKEPFYKKRTLFLKNCSLIGWIQSLNFCSTFASIWLWQWIDNKNTMVRIESYLTKGKSNNLELKGKEESRSLNSAYYLDNVSGKTILIKLRPVVNLNCLKIMETTGGILQHRLLEQICTTTFYLEKGLSEKVSLYFQIMLLTN